MKIEFELSDQEYQTFMRFQNSADGDRHLKQIMFAMDELSAFSGLIGKGLITAHNLNAFTFQAWLSPAGIFIMDEIKAANS